VWVQEGQPPSTSTSGLDCEQPAIANLLYRGVTDDLHHVLIQTEVARHLVHERRELLERLLDLLATTQCIHTQTRKTDVHVEYDDAMSSLHVRAASCVCVCS